MESIKDLSKGSASNFQARSPHLPSHQTFTLYCKLPVRKIAASQKYMCVYVYMFPRVRKKERTDLYLFLLSLAQVERAAGDVD